MPSRGARGAKTISVMPTCAFGPSPTLDSIHAATTMITVA